MVMVMVMVMVIHQYINSAPVDEVVVTLLQICFLPRHQ